MTVNVVAPVFLITPTAKSLTPPPPPPPPPPGPTGLSHYQCYKLDNVKNAPANKGVTLVDQFGPMTVDLDKRGPFRLCVPVNKNGEKYPAPHRSQRARVLHDQERPPTVPAEEHLHRQPVRLARQQDHAVRRALRAVDDPAMTGPAGAAPPPPRRATARPVRRRAPTTRSAAKHSRATAGACALARS